MSGSRTRLVAIAVIVVAVAAALPGAAREARAQGCVASRVNAPSAPLDSEGNSYYLPDGKWQVAFGYRNYRSHRHFVGSVEQDGSPGTTDRSKNEVINNVNIPELSASYGLSDRISATLDVPITFLHRRNPPRAATATNPAVPPVYTDGNGLGDITLMGRYWVGNPTRNASKNLSLGLGFKLPTGKKDKDGTFLRIVNGSLQDWVHPVDQSIQPGDGGFGFVTEVQGFKSIGDVTVFASGSYLINPKGTNGVETGRSNPREAIMSVADQFGARLGLGMPVRLVKGLGVSVNGRLEGVPSSDLFGSSAGFRRPGYSIAIEPGISYSWSKGAVAFSVPYFVRRVRTQSYADKLESEETGRFVNGDAAFADYMFVVGFTRRF